MDGSWYDCTATSAGVAPRSFWYSLAVETGFGVERSACRDEGGNWVFKSVPEPGLDPDFKNEVGRCFFARRPYSLCRRIGIKVNKRISPNSGYPLRPNGNES